MKLVMYKLMYRLTNDKRWVHLYVEEMNKQILEDIQRWRNEYVCN